MIFLTKRAELGKIITSFPTLLGLVVLMALFVFLSFAFSGNSIINNFSQPPNLNVLTQKTSGDKLVFDEVLDLLGVSDLSTSYKNQLESEQNLNGFAQGKKICLLISSIDKILFSCDLINDKCEKMSQKSYEYYLKNDLVSRFSLNYVGSSGKVKSTLFIYSGECLHRGVKNE